MNRVWRIEDIKIVCVRRSQPGFSKEMMHLPAVSDTREEKTTPHSPKITKCKSHPFKLNLTEACLCKKCNEASGDGGEAGDAYAGSTVSEDGSGLSGGRKRPSGKAGRRLIGDGGLAGNLNGLVDNGRNNGGH